MGFFRVFFLIIVGAAAFGVLLAAFGSGNLEDIPLVNYLIMAVPALIIGLAAGASPTPRTHNTKSPVRGMFDGGLLAGLAALLGGAVVVIIGLANAVQVAGGVAVLSPGEALLRGSLLPGAAYLTLGLVFGLLGALLGRVLGGRR